MLLILISNDDSRIDSEYVVHEFEGEIEKREFKLDHFSTLCFIYDVDPLDANGTKKTKMLGSAPVLNIVNSEDYRVEKKTVKKGDVVKIHMASGGGFAARLD